MKLVKRTIQTIKAEEGKRYLELTFEGEKVTGFDSNLPYEKSIEDWLFYAKAIAKIIKKQ
uniref:Uncharacterized protein n=1 Tax=viral metagenome TaxID=1070528 RepID=A0A6M3IR81_9ZZZZ